MLGRIQHELIPFGMLAKCFAEFLEADCRVDVRTQRRLAVTDFAAERKAAQAAS
jgi:hypothetical protein